MLISAVYIYYKPMNFNSLLMSDSYYLFNHVKPVLCSDLWIREVKLAEVNKLAERHKKLLRDKARLTKQVCCHQLWPLGTAVGHLGTVTVLTFLMHHFYVALDENINSICQGD